MMYHAAAAGVLYLYYITYVVSSQRGPCPTVSEQFLENWKISLIIAAYGLLAKPSPSLPYVLCGMIGIFLFDTNSRLEKVVERGIKNSLHMIFVVILILIKVATTDRTHGPGYLILYYGVIAGVFAGFGNRINKHYNDLMLFHLRNYAESLDSRFVLIFSLRLILTHYC